MSWLRNGHRSRDLSAHCAQRPSQWLICTALCRQDDAPSTDEFGDVLAEMYAQSSSKQLALDRAVFRSLCDEVLTAQVRLRSALRTSAARPLCFV